MVIENNRKGGEIPECNGKNQQRYFPFAFGSFERFFNIFPVC